MTKCGLTGIENCEDSCFDCNKMKRPIDSVTINGIPIMDLKAAAEFLSIKDGPDYGGTITIKCSGCDAILSVPADEYLVDREYLCTGCTLKKRRLNE